MLGAILLQPQLLQRLPGRSAGDDLLDEIVAIGHQLALNPAAAEAVGPAFASAGTALAETLMARLTPRLPQALAELRALADPVLAAVSGFNGLQAPASAADMLTLLANALTQFGSLLDLLGEDQIRATVRRVAAICGDTLGLSQQGLRDDLVAMLRAARDALREGNDTLPPESAAIREAMACLLARIEVEAFGAMPVLDLSGDRLADALILRLRRTPLPAVLGKADCLIDKLKALLLALADAARALALVPRAAPPAPARPAGRRRRAAARRHPVAQAVLRVLSRDDPSNPTTPTPPRSDDGQYCWYASWLYATRRQGFGEGNGFFADATNQWDRAIAQTFIPGFPKDEVWHSKDKRKLVLRRFGIDADELLHQSDQPFEWYEAPQFSDTPSAERFSFGVIPPEAMEVWTRLSSILMQAGAGAWHAALMGGSPREYANNINLMISHFVEFIAMGAGGAPLGSLISRAGNLSTFATWTVNALLPALVFLACSFEGVHHNENFELTVRQWLLILIGDVFSAAKVSIITGIVHNVLLSLFTMMNYSGPGLAPSGVDTRPKNWDMAEPFIDLVNTIAGMVYTGLISRDNYGLPFDNSGAFKAQPLILPLDFPGALGVGVLGNLVGTLLAWAISRTATPTQLGKKIGLGALASMVTFAVGFYGDREGDTDGGRYNPTKRPDDKPYSPAHLPLQGYPDKAGSPYRLPYAKDVALYVPQANLGIVSHSRFNGDPQVYAYDFGHDFKDEILAVRDGTVVDFYDWNPDNVDPSDAQMATALAEAIAAMGPGWRADGPSWNFICVRHDTQVASQDRDVGPNPVTTYAVYGHGATGGVRDLWQAKYGLGPTQIIGRKVLRGHPIMSAGSTGHSMHSHLHLHIKSGPAANTGTAPKPLVLPGDLGKYTLPFVFGDAGTPGDGVLKSLHWYKSDNPPVAAVPQP